MWVGGKRCRISVVLGDGHTAGGWWDDVDGERRELAQGKLAHLLFEGEQ